MWQDIESLLLLKGSKESLQYFKKLLEDTNMEEFFLLRDKKAWNGPRKTLMKKLVVQIVEFVDCATNEKLGRGRRKRARKTCSSKTKSSSSASATKSWAKGTGFGGKNGTTVITKSAEKRQQKQQDTLLATLKSLLELFETVFPSDPTSSARPSIPDVFFFLKLVTAKTSSSEIESLMTVVRPRRRKRAREELEEGNGVNGTSAAVGHSFINALELFLRNDSLFDISERLPFYVSLVQVLEFLFSRAETKILLLIPELFEVKTENEKSKGSMSVSALLENMCASKGFKLLAKQQNLQNHLMDFDDFVDASYEAELRSLVFSLEGLNTKMNSVGHEYAKMKTLVPKETFLENKDERQNGSGESLLSEIRKLLASVTGDKINLTKSKRRELIEEIVFLERKNLWDIESAERDEFVKEVYEKIMRDLCFKAMEISFLCNRNVVDHYFLHQASQLRKFSLAELVSCFTLLFRIRG